MQADIQKILRNARRLPDKQGPFYKVLYEFMLSEFYSVNSSPK